MLRIGLISDVHASPEPLREALNVLREQRVDTIFCAGDIAGYGMQLDETVEMLIESGCRSVVGNHDLWHLEKDGQETESMATRYLQSLPMSIDMDVEGFSLTMVHASPSGDLLDGIRLLDESGKLIHKQKVYWARTLNEHPTDILVVGHTHQVFAEQLGDVFIINPGSTLFNHTCAILTLPGKKVETFSLSDKEPLLSWNFSMFKDRSW